MIDRIAFLLLPIIVVILFSLVYKVKINRFLSLLAIFSTLIRPLDLFFEEFILVKYVVPLHALVRVNKFYGHISLSKLKGMKLLVSVWLVSATINLGNNSVDWFLDIFFFALFALVASDIYDRLGGKLYGYAVIWLSLIFGITGLLSYYGLNDGRLMTRVVPDSMNYSVIFGITGSNLVYILIPFGYLYALKHTTSRITKLVFLLIVVIPTVLSMKRIAIIVATLVLYVAHGSLTFILALTFGLLLIQNANLGILQGAINRFSIINSEVDTTSSSRLKRLEYGLEMYIQGSLLFGRGVGALKHTHNFFLELLVNTGIIGLITSLRCVFLNSRRSGDKRLKFFVFLIVSLTIALEDIISRETMSALMMLYVVPLIKDSHNWKTLR